MHVIVVGGGVIGLAIAWRAARAGLSVTVVDPKPGHGASRSSAGMLAPVGEATYGERPLLDLTLAAADRYPAFITELEAAAGGSVEYVSSGMLTVARDADENAELDRDFAFRQSLGLAVQRLSASECRRLEPGLAPGVRGGMLAPSDSQVDPRRLVGALMRACDRARVAVVCERASLRVEDGRAAGVCLTSGEELAADAVVLAAGCWSGTIDGVPADAAPPVRPVKGQTLRLVGPRSPRLISRMVRSRDVYIVPRQDGRVFIGATVEERGFDTAVTAGAVYELLRDARELVPDVAELELVSVNVGLRPGTPDNGPIIGESSVPGLFIASGHYRNGILLTPITADAVVAQLTHSEPPAATAPFTPARFTRAFEVVS